MIFYWVHDRIRSNHFHIFWEEGRKKPGRIFHKTPPNMATQNYAAKIFETRNTRCGKIKIPKDWNRKRVIRNYQSQGNPETV